MLAAEPGHDRPRATYLESLSFTEDSDSDQESDEDASTSDISESVHLIVDLLSNTPNLRRLSFENFHESVNSSETLVESLTSLRRLNFLHVDPVADVSLAVVRSIPSDLKHLSLDYQDKELFELPDEDFTISAFFDTISAFRNLTHIELNNFTLPTPTSPISHTFPSIRHVKVSGQPWIVDLCPNVCTVSVALSLISHRIEVLPASSRWPPLRRLTIVSDEELTVIRSRLPSVDALEVSLQKAMTQRTLLGGHSDAEESSFVGCLRRVNPISLQRKFLFASSILPAVLAGTPVLRNMVSAAPRLRSLKISLEWVRIPEGGNFREGLAESLTRALSSLPLVALHVWVEPGASQHYAASPWIIRARELSQLPAKFVQALSRLCVLCLPYTDSDPHIQDGLIRARDNPGAEAELGDDSRSKIDPLIPIRSQWWIIPSREDGERTMKKVSSVDGERALLYVENPRWDPSTGLNGLI